MQETIIGIVGSIGSGKSDAAAYLLKKYAHLKVETLSFSTVLRKILQGIKVEESRGTLIDLGASLRERFGQDLIGKYMAKQVESGDADLFIVEGFRCEGDLAKLADLDNFYLINITANPEIRYERLISRNQNAGDKNKSYEEFIADQELEPEKNIPAIAKKANVTIENNGTLTEFQLRLELVVRDLLSPKESASTNKGSNYDYLDYDYL